MFFFKERFQKKKKEASFKKYMVSNRGFQNFYHVKKKKKFQNLTKKYFLRKECFSKILMLIL